MGQSADREVADDGERDRHRGDGDPDGPPDDGGRPAATRCDPPREPPGDGQRRQRHDEHVVVGGDRRVAVGRGGHGPEPTAERAVQAGQRSGGAQGASAVEGIHAATATHPTAAAAATLAGADERVEVGAVVVTPGAYGGGSAGERPGYRAVMMRMPAEWEPHELTLIAWPTELRDRHLWHDQLDVARAVHAEIARRSPASSRC